MATTNPANRDKCSDTEFDRMQSAIAKGSDQLSTALDEARSEPSFSRFNDADYSAAVEELNQLKQRLLALCRDSDLYSRATVVDALVPEPKGLTEEMSNLSTSMASKVRRGDTEFNIEELDKTKHDLDRRLQQLRDVRATSPFNLDKMLPFWSFLFNLKEMARSLRDLQQHLTKLS